MISITQLFLFIVNAVTFRRIFTIFTFRVVVILLLYQSIISLISLNAEIGIDGNLFHLTAITIVLPSIYHKFY